MAFSVTLPELNIREGVRNTSVYDVSLNIPAGYVDNIEISHSPFPYFNITALSRPQGAQDFEVIRENTPQVYPFIITEYQILISYDSSVFDTLQNNTTTELKIFFISSLGAGIYEEEIIIPISIDIPLSLETNLILNDCVTGAPKRLELQWRGGVSPYSLISNRLLLDAPVQEEYGLNSYEKTIIDPERDTWEFELRNANNQRVIERIDVQEYNCLDISLIFDIKNGNCENRSVDYGVSCPDCSDGVIYVNVNSGTLVDMRWEQTVDNSDTSDLTENQLPFNTAVDSFIERNLKKWSLFNVPSGWYKGTGVGTFGETVTLFLFLESPQETVITFEKISDVLTQTRNDGQFTYSISGANTPISLNWTVQPTDENFSDYQIPEPSFQTETSGEFLNRPLSNIVAGLYTLEVVDCLGNVITEEISINEPFPISYFIDEINNACVYNPTTPENMGSVKMRITEGEAPFTLELFNPDIRFKPYILNTNTLNTEINLLGLYPYQSPYRLEIRDANGQIEEVEFNITQPYPLNVNYRIRNIKKFGDNNGSIEVYNNSDVNGEFDTYEIQAEWNGPLPSECDSIPINYNSYFEIEITNHTQVSELNLLFLPCRFRYENFNIDNATLQRTMNSISEKIDRLSGFEVEQIGDNLLRIALNFDALTIGDDCICGNTEVQIFSQGIRLFRNTICCEAIIEDEPCTVDFLPNSLIQRNLCPGTYEVKVNTEPELCADPPTSLITIKQNPELLLDPEKLDETRHDADDGIIIPNGSGGCGEYLYRFFLIEGEDETFFAETEINYIDNLPPALYRVAVIDACGVETSKEVEILPKPPFEIQLNDFTPLVPWGSCEGWIEVSIISPDNTSLYEPYHWLWTGEREYPAAEILYNNREINQNYEIGRIENLCAGVYNVSVTNSLGETRIIENIVINQEINPCDPEGDGKVIVETKNVRTEPANVLFSKSYNINLLFEIHRSTCCAFQNQNIEVEIINDNLVLADNQTPHNRITDKKVQITNNIPLKPFPLDPFPDPQFQDVIIPLVFTQSEPPGRYFIEFKLRGCNGFETTVPFNVVICGADPSFSAARDQNNNITFNYEIPETTDEFIFIPETLDITYYSDNDEGQAVSIPYVQGASNSFFVNTVNNTDVYTFSIESACLDIDVINPPILIDSDPRNCLNVQNINFRYEEGGNLFATWSYPPVNPDTDLDFSTIQIRALREDSQILNTTLSVTDNSSPIELLIANNAVAGETYNLFIKSECAEEELEAVFEIPADRICVPVSQYTATRSEDATEILMEWETPEIDQEIHQEIESIFIEYKTESSENYTSIEVGQTDNSFVIDSLTPSGIYDVRIRTVSENGECFSEVENVTPEPKECPEISEWDAVKAGPQSITVDWEFEEIDPSYDIELVNILYKIKGAEEVNKKRIDISGGNQPLSDTLISLTPDEIYEIQLEIVCENCIKNCTTEWKEVDLSMRDCPLPDNIQAIYQTETSLLITWDLPESDEVIDDIDSISIWLYNGEEATEYKLEDTGTEILIENLDTITEYQYEIETFCRCGETSNRTDRLTPSLGCPRLDNLLVEKIRNRSARLVWDFPVINPVRFQPINNISIQYREETLEESQTINVSIEENLPFETVVNNLSLESDYVFEVVSSCLQGEQAYEPLLLNTDCPLSCPNVRDWNAVRLSETEIEVSWSLVEGFQYTQVEIEYGEERVLAPASAGTLLLNNLENIDYDFNIQTLCEDRLLSCNSPSKQVPAWECPNFTVELIGATHNILSFQVIEENTENGFPNVSYGANISPFEINEDLKIDIIDLEPETEYEVIITSSCGKRVILFEKTAIDSCPPVSFLRHSIENNDLVFQWEYELNATSFLYRLNNEETGTRTTEKEVRLDISESVIFEITPICGEQTGTPEIIEYDPDNACPPPNNLRVLKYTEEQIIIDWDYDSEYASYEIKLNYLTNEYKYNTEDSYLDICPPEIGEVDITINVICEEGINESMLLNVEYTPICDKLESFSIIRTSPNEVNISWDSNESNQNFTISYRTNIGNVEEQIVNGNSLIVPLEQGEMISGVVEYDCGNARNQYNFEWE